MRRCLVSCIITFLIVLFGLFFLGNFMVNRETRAEKEYQEKNNAILCLSNMKQIGLAVQMYEQDYDEHLMLGHEGPLTNKYGQVGTAWWQYEVMPYVKNLGLFTCPDVVNRVYWGETSPSPDSAISYQFRSGIGLNWYLPRVGSAVGNAEGTYSSDAGWWGYNGCKLCGLDVAQVQVPAKRIILMDTNNYAMGGPNPSLGWLNYKQWKSGEHGGAFGGRYGYARHNGTSNYVFFDGHTHAYRPNQVSEIYFDLKAPDLNIGKGSTWGE